MVGGFGFEGDKTHPTAGYIGCDQTLGRNRFAWTWVTRPREFLLSVQQTVEIHSGVGVTEKLRRSCTERVDGRESWRHAGCRVGADGPRERRDPLGLELKSHWRIGAPRDSMRLGSDLATA